MNKPKLLWVGDAGCPSGFARATHNILDTLHKHYDVTVLGMNYWGDPYKYPYDLYSCFPGGDTMGIGRLVWMCDRDKPDIIVLQNDPWHIPSYIRQLRQKLSNGEYAVPEYAGIPVVASLAVDGKNFKYRWLDGVSHAIFWTKFALDEARTGEYLGPASIIPLGVDLDIYHPMDKKEACERRGIPMIADRFVVGNINRNQPRKRWDLLLRYFAAWVHKHNVEDAALYLHIAPTGDTGIDVKQMAAYYDVLKYLVLMETIVGYGVTEEQMCETYNCFDVAATTTQGEGFGLTTLEGMACGVPQIVPEWSALGDWAQGGAYMVPCVAAGVNPVAPNLNIIGGIPDGDEFVKTLDMLYRNKKIRQEYSTKALACANRPEFRWASIGEKFLGVLNATLGITAPVEQLAETRG